MREMKPITPIFRTVDRGHQTYVFDTTVDRGRTGDSRRSRTTGETLLEDI